MDGILRSRALTACCATCIFTVMLFWLFSPPDKGPGWPAPHHWRLSQRPPPPPPDGHASGKHQKPLPPISRQFPDEETRKRFESAEIWRDQRRLPEGPVWRVPAIPGEISRPITADYPDESASKTFVMIKTGGNVMWDRLPIHLWTTLTHFSQFALYSDKSGMIGGHEVIDILATLPPDLLKSENLKQHQLVQQMQSEAWGWDVADLDTNEGWAMDKFKNFPMLAHAYEHASDDTEWFLFMDADSYLLGGSLLEFLKEYDPREKLYLGNPAKGFFQDTGLWFGHGGSGVVVSRGLADALFAGRDKAEMIDHYLNKYYDECCGDAMMGYIIYEETSTVLDSLDTEIHDVGEYREKQNLLPHFHPLNENPFSPFQGNQPYRTQVYRNTWCEPLISFHSLGPHDVEILWEWDQMMAPGMVLEYDWYRDFILPYLMESRSGWDIGEGDITIKEHRDDLAPHASKSDCRKAC